MTDEVKSMLLERPRGDHNALVFPTRSGSQKVQTSKTFNLTVEELKLNEGVTDQRQKVVWHSLRHTAASWFVESGVDLFVVKEILGHSVIQMTERYGHLSHGTLQNAIRNLEKSIEAARKKAGQVVNFTK